MLHKLIRGLAPLAAIAVGASLSGCDGANFSVNGEKGVPLSELDMSGRVPHAVVLASSDTVILRDGERISITVDGDPDAVEQVRFSIADETLAISRATGLSSAGRATVRVTLPSPRALTIAGSGTLEAESLTGDGDIADINVLGSGKVRIGRITAEKLSVNVAGSGALAGSGTTDRLDMNLLGSGSAALEGLKAARAKLTIAGSGDATFASDGEVNADVMGSGSVTVVGRATCKVKSMGSGTVTCRPAAEAETAQKTDKKAKRSAAKDTKGRSKRDG